MKFLEVAELLIPGYNLLSKKDRDDFEKSPPGKTLTSVVSEITTSLNELQNSFAWWQYFILNIDEKLTIKKQEISAKKTQLIHQIEADKEYKTLIRAIILVLLPETCADFALLNEEEKNRLADAQFSQKLLSLIPLDRKIHKLYNEFPVSSMWQREGQSGAINEQITLLEQEKENIIKEWRMQFATLAEVSELRDVIAKEKDRARLAKIQSELTHLGRRVDELAEFFDWIKLAPSAVSEIKEQYSRALHQGVLDTAKIEKDELILLIFHRLEQATRNQFDYVNLHYFNLEQSRLLADLVLDAFNSQNVLQIDSWLGNYQKKLAKKLHHDLLLINNKLWTSSSQPQGELLGSLSSLFWHSKTVEKSKEFLNKLADAHAFIQATGFSTQNESSFLAIIDIYNYGRTAEQIAETRRIISSILAPFAPLYAEYRDIAFYEKNNYLKILRTVMPLLIVAAFVTLVAALLAPLAIPELAFTVILIPALFLGLALATKYVAIKDNLYKTLREIYYGGPFEIPEFQVNARMAAIFTTEENAECIRNFYVEELQRCDQIEVLFQSKGDDGLLRQNELEQRKENLVRRHTLCLEWYDIHSNVNLGYEKVPQLVLNRLVETGHREYEALKTTLQKEFPKVEDTITVVTRKLKTPSETELQKSVVSSPGKSNYPMLSKNYSPSLFKPVQSLAHKMGAQHLDAVATMIQLQA
ncbi:hypothetical protein [Legionella hackeliae]|nr:hypothetical protein [Legionella hackeliae]KTD15167.1 hypothetical protein Lhac_0009 [Legionella hackeliae]STX48240.1 Uncharacterised protein [Legionella hackeliae]